MVGKIARAKIPLQDKRPLYLKLQEQIGDKLERPFSPRFEAGEIQVKIGDDIATRYLTGVQKELLALYRGEVIPEIMARQKGIFAKTMEFFRGKGGLFNKLDGKVKRLKKTDPAGYAKAADDQVAVLNEYLRQFDDRPYEAGGAEGTGLQAAKATEGMLKVDDSYYLDSSYYTQKGTEYYHLKNINDAADGPFLDGPNIDQAIRITVGLNEGYRARNVLIEQIKSVQDRNAKIVGTREFDAVRTASLVNDSSLRIPKGTRKPFAAEVSRLQKMNRELPSLDYKAELKRLADSDLSPAERYAIRGELNKIKQVQDANGPGLAKQTGETPYTKEELAYMNSPVVLPEEFILNSSGKGKIETSQRYIVRLIKPWSKEFETSFRRHLQTMKKIGKSVAERDALIANVMEVFNQGNALLLSDGLKSLVADIAIKRVIAELAPDRRHASVITLFDEAQQDRLKAGIQEWLGHYDLPFSGLPKAADYSKRSVQTARVLGEIPTTFTYVLQTAGKETPPLRIPIDLLDIIPEAWGLLTKKDKQIIILEGVRNLGSKVVSQSKFMGLGNVQENEMRRFGISHSDTPLMAAAKMAYHTVFAKDANPMALPEALSRDSVKTLVDAEGKKSKVTELEVYHIDETDLTSAMSDNPQAFIETLQEVHQQDMREQLANRHDRNANELNADLEGVINEVNKKEGTTYDYTLSDKFLEAAFGKQTGKDWIAHTDSRMSNFKDMLDRFRSSRKAAKEATAKLNPFHSGKRIANLNKELELIASPFIEMFSELDDAGHRKMIVPDDTMVAVAPQELRPNRILDIPLNPEFLDVIAWDAQLARDMGSAMSRASSLVKAGLTVRSAITQAGNIIGNTLAISATTGEGLIAVAARVAESEILFYNYKKNKGRFQEYLKNNDMPSDIVRAIDSIDKYTALDLMDGLNAEIGIQARKVIGASYVGKAKTAKLKLGGQDTGLRYPTTAGIKRAADIAALPITGKYGLNRLQEFMYKKGDAAPRRAEVLREFLEGLDLVEKIDVDTYARFQVSRKGYTTLYRDKDGIYIMNRKGRKVRPTKSNPFVDKVLAAYAVRKVSGRVFNYRDVPRIVEVIRSGALGAISSLIFSPFVSFPYLAADFLGGKRGILASTLFEPLFDRSIITNNIKIIASRAVSQTARGARRGMLMTWAQGQRYPNANEVGEDAKFRRDANTFGAILPSASSRPGHYRYFSWANANGFETSFAILDYALAWQAWFAEGVQKYALRMSEKEIIEKRTPLMRTMVARMNAKESGTLKQLGEIFTFGGNLLMGLITDWDEKGVPTGLAVQRASAAIMGKDQSRFLLATMTRAGGISPTSPLSPYYSKTRADFQNNIHSAEQWMDLPKEKKKEILRKNFWPIITRFQFREKPLLKRSTSAGGKIKVTNDAIDYFRKGLEEELLGDIKEKIGDPPETEEQEATQFKTKLYQVESRSELNRLRKVQRNILREVDWIVRDMVSMFENIETEETMRQQYKSVLTGRGKPDIDYPLFTRQKKRTQVARKTFQEARRRAAGLALKRQAIERQAKQGE